MNRYSVLYSPKFVRQLIYMLQSVEYDTWQYLRWFWLQGDYSELKNKRTKPTPKSRLLVFSGAVIYLVLASVAAWLFLWLVSDSSLPRTLLLVGFLALIPVLLAHLLAGVSFIGRWLIQKPLEIIRKRRIKDVFSDHPGKVIVIAGSYGKTSMKHMLGAVLGAKLKVAATSGNFNTPAGIARFASSLSGDEDVLIVEAGEYRPGDVAFICDMVNPDIGFITGVNEQHLSHMKSVANALTTVFELAEALPEKAALYVNAESQHLEGHIQKADLAYSRDGITGFKISKFATNLGGTKLTIKPKKGQGFEISTSLMGLHQAGPIAAAVHLADSLGLKPAEIKKGFNSMEAHNRRFKPQEIDGVAVIDDSYNGNPDGFLAGIEFLKGLKAKRKVYVTPGMIELGRLSPDAHFAVGQKLASSGVDLVILNKNPATGQIDAGLKAGKYKGETAWLGEQDNFLEHISDFTQKGDVVLLQNSPRERFFYL